MSETEPAATPEPQDMRPLVGAPASNRAVWLFGTSLAIAAVLLFSALENHRSGITAPAIGVGAGATDTDDVISSAPELAVPPDYQQQQPITAPQANYAPQPVVPAATVPTPASPQPRRLIAAPATPPIDLDTPRVSQSDLTRPIAATLSPVPQVVFEASRAQPAAANDTADAGKGESRVLAGRFANPATTVPKGTVIQAVMETALDSTRAGFARAIISRDIYGFDGSKILIPKGSRIIGEYKADLAAGQSRALIQWQRLMRPDGVIIDLDSPSADPLGRAGVKGKVNNHFFQKFGGAILQSALDIGVQVASNKIASSNGTTIYAPWLYALPGTVQNSTSISSPEKVQPTLTVRQGTSVSVFVARDLDFTTVDQ